MRPPTKRAPAPWYAAAADEPSRRGVFERHYDAVWSAFAAAKRPADLIRLFNGDALKASITMSSGTPFFSRADGLREMVLPRLTDLYGACLAIGRADYTDAIRAAIEGRFGARSVRDQLDAAPGRWTVAPTRAP